MTAQFYQMLQALNKSVFGNEYKGTESEVDSVYALASIYIPLKPTGIIYSSISSRYSNLKLIYKKR